MTTLISRLKENNRNEVINQLKYSAPEKKHAKERYIGVKNGIYDLENNELISERDPDIILTNQVDADYNTAANNKDMLNFFEDLAGGDEELVFLLEEIIGYTLYRNNKFNKSIVLVGTGGNGKSLFINVLTGLLGIENIASLSIQDLNSRFKPAMLNGKLANLGDDVSAHAIKDTSMFKKLSTGERLTVEFKGKDAFTFRSFAKLIFTANQVPVFNDNSQGLKDRLLIVPFNQRFRGTDKEDPDLEEKLTNKDAKSTALNIAIRGLQRLLKNGKFTIPNSIESAMEDFQINNNPINEWLNDKWESEEDIHGVSVDNAHADYKKWCEENGYKEIISKKKLTMELMGLGYKSSRSYVNDRQVRVYKRKKLVDVISIIYI